MTAATADRQLPGPPGALDLLPSIDMTSLSQSELRALSLCSASRASHGSQAAIPAIDRSIFNESAGSRRQTFSRPSPHHHHHHHRHRLAGVLPKAAAAATPLASSTTPEHLDDPDRPEDLTVIRFLKQCLATHPDFQQEELDLFSHFENPAQFVAEASPEASPQRKRKRGRKPKVKLAVNKEQKRPRVEEKFVEEKLEVVNKHGDVVDLVELASLEDPFREELRRKTLGMMKEDELLGFLRDLEGEWCSRRRKRKFVDAGELGDALPVGWRVLLGLKRKEGRAWVYCRRYVSPGGQHFLSCKEVSEYMQSVLGGHSAEQGNDSNNQLDNGPVSVTNGDVNREVDNGRHSDSNKRDKELLMLEMNSLAEVEVHSLFECHKCNMTFGERDLYLNHLLSYHQKTTRKYRLGSSVGDGVIVKDGKYECQFCHKVFHERRRYNGHVGVHVRNYVRGVDESPAERTTLQKPTDIPAEDELPSRISKMDALIEIAQNSIRETSSFVPNHESNPEVATDSPLPDVEMQDGTKEKTPEPQVEKESVKLSENVGKVAEGSTANITLEQEVQQLDGKTVVPHGGSEDIIVGSAAIDSSTANITSEQKVQQLHSDLSIESTPFAMPDKGTNEVDGELRVEDMELVGLETEVRRDESVRAEIDSMFGGATGPLDSGFGSSTVQGSEELPTMCTWCGVEFGYASSGSGGQSGSGGYMCHSCKLKVSMELDG